MNAGIGGGAGEAHDQAEVGDQAVVDAEDGGAQGAAAAGAVPALGAAAFGEGAEDAGVGAFVRGQGRGGGVLRGVIGSAGDLHAVEDGVDHAVAEDAGDCLDGARLGAELVVGQGHAKLAQAALHNAGVADLGLRHLAEDGAALLVGLAPGEIRVEVSGVQFVVPVREHESGVGRRPFVRRRSHVTNPKQAGGPESTL